MKRITNTVQRHNGFSILLLTLMTLFMQASQVAGEVYTMNGFKIEVILVPDQATVMLGEPVYLSFVVKNRSEQDLYVMQGGDYRNALGRPESFTVTAIGPDGENAPQLDAGGCLGGISCLRKVPAGGSYVFELFLPHWAIFEQAGEYSLIAKRTLQCRREEIDYSEKAKGDEGMFDVEVQSSAKIQIVPRDEKKIGELITSLGKTMLGENLAEAETAAYTLSYIQDERVIPYFVEAFEIRNYSHYFVALDVLSRFNDDAAFTILKKGMEVQAEDINETTVRAELKEGRAGLIRHSAAVCLAQSPHPESLPFLLTKRDDASEAVRITVLQTLGEVPANVAVPILQEMVDDESELVRGEAKRYLKLFEDECK